ncbi:MAG: glycosyltransferase [Acidimicrobiales bacterium]
MSLRVLMWTPAAQEIPGGHKVQMERTASAVRSLGVDVVEAIDEEPPIEGFSVVHGYGLSAQQVRRSREGGTPVCLSTIYCSRRWSLGLDQRVGGGVQLGRRIRLAAVLGRSAMRLRHVEKMEDLLVSTTDRRSAFECADLLMPNSALEGEMIRSELDVTTPMHVVPNGVDPTVFDHGAAAPERDATVLYVGRFEPHKNQLGLIRALARRPYRLVLVGARHPHHQRYYTRCRATASSGVEFVDPVSQCDLPAFYGSAAVHALPSWYETTGLVSLEAAACGAKVVSTDRGYAREYLGDDAWYCDPADRRSIASAVDQAMEAPFESALRDRVMTQFTWEQAGKATVQAYERVLSRRPAAPR